MGTEENINKSHLSEFGLDLPLKRESKKTRPTTIQKYIPKTNPTIVPNSKCASRSGAVSRAGHHRWPQATMVVKGGREHKFFETEMLSVSTKENNNNKELNNNYEKSKEENMFESKTTFPDIMPSSVPNHNTLELGPKAVPSRFATRSPPKLPRFYKNLISQPSHENGNRTKLIRNIKFWRGTTPAARETPSLTAHHQTDNQENNKDEIKQGYVKEHDSILQSWNEQLSILEESSKDKFYTWHMALRERLLKHEKLHYHEAVTRINKYRQRLRRRQTGHQEPTENTDVQMWKNFLQQQSSHKKPNVAPSGVSMSPTQEWKPYILNRNDHDDGQKRPPFFGKPATLANVTAKKHMRTSGNIMSGTLNKKLKTQPNPDRESTNYPVHGESLLKEGKDVKNMLPRIETMKSDVNPNTSDEDMDDDKTVTRVLLGNLKKQLISGFVSENNTKENADHEQTAPIHQAKTEIGAKLKLLLQNNAQAQNENNREKDGARSVATAKYNVRSTMNSQNKQYRPLTRPHTFGEGPLPAINNIVSSSLWKQHTYTNRKPEIKVKHRLTLTGVANRKSFSTSVIGISKKHIVNRKKDHDSDNEDDEETNEHNVIVNKPHTVGENNRRKLLQIVSTKPNTAQQAQIKNDSNGNNLEENALTKTQNELLNKEWRKKNPAYRMYSSSSLWHQKHDASASLPNFSKRENPQYKSLKLITSLSGTQQQTLKSNAGNDAENETLRQALKGKKQAATGKHKVLRVAVVEPPLTAKERYQRQQQVEKSNKRLTFNPTHAAVANFTTAILNSEMDLRAPSSSPVDMFFRNYYGQHFGRDSADLLAIKQAAAESLQECGVKTEDIVTTIENLSKEELTINPMDGLKLPRPQLETEDCKSNGLHKHTKKVVSTPKVKDLADLHRLYHVMKKHGEAYTNNGAAYYYSQSPVSKLAMTPENISKQQVIRQHTNQKHLHKKPYYYYPYQENESCEPATPLYVVTGANSTGMQKRQPYIKTDIDAGHTAVTPYQHHLFEKTAPRAKWHQQELSRNRTSAQLSKRHELTVMMPKTPGIMMTAHLPLTHLEQIKEHVRH
ncbi:uncharacterized protein LOC143449653 isoform X2 [Clavelina lepadiformis]|uniref:uncharacterized protein LOC143449653 isoform X2 n=1 Tax=Clavelina lepadiformis TaxID=159417 RepID=UPI0040436952